MPVARKHDPRSNVRWNKNGLSVRYHGNYCGPGWSNGKWQKSVCGSLPGIDNFDNSCKRHDCASIKGRNRAADIAFYEENIGKGFKRSAAALAVYSTMPALGKRVRKVARFVRKRRKLNPSQIDSRAGRFGGVVSEDEQNLYNDVVPEKNSNSGQMRGAGGYTGGRVKLHRSKKDPYASHLKYTQEFQGTVTDYNCGYIGHSTLVQKRMLTAMVESLLRAILAKHGCEIYDLDLNIASSFKLTWYGRISPVAPISSAFTTTYVFATPKTLAVVATEAEAQFATYFQTNPSAIMDYVEYLPSTDSALNITSLNGRYVFNTSTFDYDVISTLKVQNRTTHVSSVDGETTNVVDISPLVGRTYAGLGAGTWMKAQQSPVTGTSLMVRTNASPVIALAPTTGGANPQMSEPPAASQLSRVLKSGYVKFEPGEVKTHVLRSHYHGSIQKWLTILCPLYAQVQNTTQKFGKYQLMAVEKLVQFKTPASDTSIVLMYEINFQERMKCSVKHQSNVMVAKFDKQADTFFV